MRNRLFSSNHKNNRAIKPLPSKGLHKAMETYGIGAIIFGFLSVVSDSVEAHADEHNLLCLCKSFLATYSILNPFPPIKLSPRNGYNLEFATLRDQQDKIERLINLLPRSDLLPKALSSIKRGQHDYLERLSREVRKYENILSGLTGSTKIINLSEECPDTFKKALNDYRFKKLARWERVTQDSSYRDMRETKFIELMCFIMMCASLSQMVEAVPAILLSMMLGYFFFRDFQSTQKDLDKTAMNRMFRHYTDDDVRDELVFFKKLVNERKQVLDSKIMKFANPVVTTKQRR